MRMNHIIQIALILAVSSCSKSEAPTPATEKPITPASTAATPATQPAAVPATVNKSMPAKEAADKLVEAGILANCKEVVPAKISARASERWDCDLPSVPGEGASVMSHAKDEDYEATVKGYEAMAMLTGSHRYGNPKARVFVQLNDGAPLDVGKKTKTLVASF